MQGEFGDQMHPQTIPPGPLAKWALFHLLIWGKISLWTPKNLGIWFKDCGRAFVVHLQVVG